MQYPPQCEHGNKNEKQEKTHAQIHKESISTALGHHRQSSGGSKSYSNVGSTILPGDINCGFHIASMKHHEVTLTLTMHDQSIKSSVLRRILSIGSEIKCLSDVNLHESSHGISALQHLHEIFNSPQKQKKHQQFGTVHQKTTQKQQKPNQFMWRVRNLHTRILTTMEEFDWRGMLNNWRNNKENTVSCDQRDDVQAWS